MKSIANFILTAIICAALFECVGCASGQWVPYEEKRATPGDHLYWDHGRPCVDLNSDTTMELADVEYTRTGVGTGSGKIGRMVLARGTSSYWSGTHQAQAGSNTAATIWATMTVPAYEKYAGTVLDKTFVAALPLVSQWIGGKMQVDLLEANKQPAILELAKLIINGGLSNQMRQQVAVAAPDILRAAEDVAAGQPVSPITPAPAPQVKPSAVEEDDDNHMKRLS